MLVITREPGQRVMIGEDVIIKVQSMTGTEVKAVVAVNGSYKAITMPLKQPVTLSVGIKASIGAIGRGQAKIAVEAPDSVTIKREELIARGWVD